MVAVDAVISQSYASQFQVALIEIVDSLQRLIAQNASAQATPAVLLFLSSFSKIRNCLLPHIVQVILVIK